MANELTPVVVGKAWNEGAKLRALLLETPPELAAKHTVPGQYVRAQVEGVAKEAFLALANPPGAQLELLVQLLEPPDPSRPADRIAMLKQGDPLWISEPAGKGFPIDGEKTRDILLFAGGSGISAIRSVVDHIARHREQWGRVVLFIGARTLEDLAYRTTWEQWRNAKIEVEATLSRPKEGWSGRRGYVQAALSEVNPHARNASAFVAGGKEFTAAVVEALATLGVQRIFKNF